MFYLSGRGNLPGYSKTSTEDEFGWYLEDRQIIEDKIYDNSSRVVRSPKLVNGVNRVEPTVNAATPLNSTLSILTCNDCDDQSKNYELPREFTKRENEENYSTETEEIEMNSLKKSVNHEIDLEMIENDADRAIFTSTLQSTRNHFVDNNDNENVQNRPRGICYTPERLVRAQEYRILTPSPRYLAIPRNAPNGIDDFSQRKYRGHRRKIGDLIDAKQFGASQLEALLDSGVPEIHLPIANRRRQNFRDRISMKKNIESDYPNELREPLEIANRDSPEVFETPADLASSGSSFEKLNSSWEERANIIRGSSQDDTSGIHSNDWSTDTPSDIPTPICLCDELATASKSFITVKESRSRVSAINEVVSILEGLEKDPERAAAALLEEDRFCDGTSGHDRLTRLALSIEQDGSVPLVLGDPENLVIELGEKVERLQDTARNILKDIDVLREDFESNESKVDDLMDATVTLRRDTKEMRYLDDLLNLLDGELERISRRNWPFVFGHNRAEDMNLVV